MSQDASTVRRVYRDASAAWHVSSRVTERLALVLTVPRMRTTQRAIKKRGGVISEHPRNRWDGDYRFLPPFFFPPFFAILPP
jgi:hypothetical protein